ncbi:5-oxoprolinase subunit PxpA [Wenyingzhuangia sp. IMCC45533]
MDINADLGEGFLFDEELMQMISSCNIACGGHTGNLNSMQSTIRLAKKHGVIIGAHPSYPDSNFFGRKEMNIEYIVLKKSLKNQILNLIEIAKEQNTTVKYVKPHGALYNKAAVDITTANLIVSVVNEIDPSLAIMGLANSVMEEIAKQHRLKFIKESFADRRYNADGTLVNRSHPLAVIHQKEEVWKQVKSLMFSKSITAINGENIDLEVDSICFHGDTPEALELLTYVKEQFLNYAVKIKSCV